VSHSDELPPPEESATKPLGEWEAAIDELGAIMGLLKESK